MTKKVDSIKLHHRWALGEKLSDTEQKQLDAWYAVQDATEIFKTDNAGILNIDASVLKGQINDLLRDISQMFLKIQQLTAENELLKKENEKLKRVLGQRLRQQTA